MINIPSPLHSREVKIAQLTRQEIASTGHFGVLLSSFNSDPAGKNNPLYERAESLLQHIAASLNYPGTKMPQALKPHFPFSEMFEATFGSGGPLPAFITMMSAKLHLNAAQNQAFQDIAIRNKDAIKTPATVQKIAKELQQAGIGHQPNARMNLKMSTP